MDFSGSDLVFKSTPSYSPPRRELTSSIPRSRRRVGPLPLADTSRQLLEGRWEGLARGYEFTQLRLALSSAKSALAVST
jgi:hypothetical protein